MRTICVVGAILFGMVAGFPTTSASNEDSYDSKGMKALVELPIGAPQASSWGKARIYKSGDQIALGIAHGFSRDELLDPDRIRRILALIKVAFSQPDYITDDQDRDPTVTLLLLSFLDQGVSDSTSKKAIIDAKKYVCTQSEKRHGGSGNLCGD